MAYDELRELADHGNISCGTALNELLDEVERQAKEIVELRNANGDLALKWATGEDENTDLTTDRDEWKRMYNDCVSGMKGQKAIIERLKKEIELYGN